ncbi:MAG: bifunctional oligoribonuclease/PAP phosphatase NrnA [Clostridia bacterium]|nr:bifunctional oligoribonuclease/PAP phosphatase NrnA [Clostridia bacterium]
MFEKVIGSIKKYDKIIIHRHENPDGDALGSQIGLAVLIRENFPSKTVFTVGDATKRYAFMDGADMNEIPDEMYSGALAVILDSATAALVSDKRFSLASATARIDHHIWCETFTDVEIVDTSFESCAGMIAALAVEAGWTISKASATAIYTGMVTDSGRFRYDSTSARTFSLAATLMEHDIDTTELYRNLYSEELSSVKRRAAFLSKITMYKDSAVAYMYNTREEIEALGMDTFAVSRGMVNVMSDIKGIDIWVNFTESEDGPVWCELRSSKYNINPVAVKYGGGGHKKASGADVKNFDEALMMLEDLKKLAEDGDEC